MKRTEIVVLCEDEAQGTFIRTFLKERGYNHEIRIIPYPSGKGSGAKYVINNVAKELAAIRQWKAKSLIVMIDEDTLGLEQRKGQLDKACKDEKVKPRKPDESVLYLVPARNIETWFHYLKGNKVDKKKDYKQTFNSDQARSSAKELHRMCYKSQALRKPAPDSLLDACEEWKRFTQS